MSLKAKVEAVVYAAEEPVTLAALAGIFAAEISHGLSEAAVEQSVAEPATEQIPLEGLASEASPEDTSPAPEDGSPAAEPVEADEKKLARLRDRQIRQVLQQVLDELIADYANGERGMEIREIAGGYRMATKPEYHDAVRGFVKSLKPPMKLSLQALETLAVIAYKQPVTAPEVSEIRGVDSGGVLGSLVSRKLITTAGRKQVIGRPILYKTTKEFLLRFGLKDVNDLPSMEEFEKMAGELAESEAEGETQDAENVAASAEGQPDSAAEQTAEAAAVEQTGEAAAAEQTPEAATAEQSDEAAAAEQATEAATAEQNDEAAAAEQAIEAVAEEATEAVAEQAAEAAAEQATEAVTVNQPGEDVPAAEPIMEAAAIERTTEEGPSEQAAEPQAEHQV
jgi:segregation and condensation protein B